MNFVIHQNASKMAFNLSKRVSDFSRQEPAGIWWHSVKRCVWSEKVTDPFPGRFPGLPGLISTTETSSILFILTFAKSDHKRKKNYANIFNLSDGSKNRLRENHRYAAGVVYNILLASCRKEFRPAIINALQSYLNESNARKITVHDDQKLGSRREIPARRLYFWCV